MKKLFILLVLCAAPLSAQTVPADFHGWFLGQVAGKPFGQQTLLEIAPLLPCVGSQITPPNAVGERTKIWDPTTNQWTRVGFGEGSWMWIGQGVTTPPAPQPCSTANPTSGSITGTPPPLDLSQVLSRLDYIIAQNERIYADEVNRLTALSAQVKAHDEKTSAIVAFFGNRYTQLFLAAAGTWLTTNRVMQ